MSIEDKLAIMFSSVSIVLGIITAIINFKDARDAKEYVKEQTRRLVDKHKNERE